MIKITSIEMKNFLSCGNVPQTIQLDKNGFSLVLGENLDLGANGNRNGVGKSTILQAISYALYGESLTSIKKDNLINTINGKNMYVIVKFETNGHTYQIHRGRKPVFFKFIVDDKDTADDATDEAQGENKDSQKKIDEILGMSHTLFKHVVALNTYTEPFLSIGAGKQREIIEELLGITELSRKAERLKERIKVSKTGIEQEEFRIRTIKQSNERIQLAIDEISKKSSAWDKQHINKIKDLDDSIKSLETIDVDTEVQSHRDLEIYNELTNSKLQVSRDISTKSRHLSQLTTQLNSAILNYDKASNHECPTCGQGIHDTEHEKIKADLESKLVNLDTQVKHEQSEVDKHTEELSVLDTALSNLSKPTTIYKSLEQALNHKNTLDQLHKDLEREMDTINPYQDQSSSIHSTIQEVNYDEINRLAKEKEHEEFLLKLLTNKDSFIRKKIIDQNLSYLNLRLSDYLNKLGLPHKVKFINDLSVEIKMMGKDLDFDNLSRGERTRLIIGLSWAFRDIFENGRQAINVVLVDELLDNGLDQAGLESSIEILKKMERERNKNIFVISHREELINRVSNVLTVIKENGFTTFSWDHSPTMHS